MMGSSHRSFFYGVCGIARFCVFEEEVRERVYCTMSFFFFSSDDDFPTPTATHKTTKKFEDHFLCDLFLDRTI